MFTKFGSFYKIDNNNIRNTNNNKTKISDNNQTAKTDYSDNNFDKSNQPYTVIDKQNAIYQGYIARHRRLSAEIDRKNTTR